MLLSDFVDRYLAERDVSAMYGEQLRVRCRMLQEFAGRALCVADLNCSLVNDWLSRAKDSGLSPYTVATYREHVLAVWNAAYQAELNDCPPLRLRRIKKPRLIVSAYTHSEILTLLLRASTLRGKMRNGNRRAHFWQAMIHASYSTGLRRGDLLRIFTRQIAGDGTAQIIQSKTNEPVLVRFSGDALRFAAKMQDRNGLLLPWPYRLDAMVLAFRRLRIAAGVNRGSLKWIRRAAGTYAEANRPGDGAKLLGHRSPIVFSRHYEDQSISRPAPVSPPPLA